MGGCISLYSYIKPQPRTLERGGLPLYIFIFLHQTTTKSFFSNKIQKLYIFIFLHQTTTPVEAVSLDEQLYIFIFLHQTTTYHQSLNHNFCCISLYSYIKPQRVQHVPQLHGSCISLYSYIKPQQHDQIPLYDKRCISLYSYIKPQPCHCSQFLGFVVYLYIPTSNHNYHQSLNHNFWVVYLYIPTSNHNPHD